MPDFDLDAALMTGPTNPVPSCPACGTRMFYLSGVLEPQGAELSLDRTARFECRDANCGSFRDPDGCIEVPLHVAKVTRDYEPLSRNALHRISTGRCPFCLSISGPGMEDVRDRNGLVLVWDCEDCENRWEEHLEVTHA